MSSLETTYMGLRLMNPMIAGSSGLTNSIGNLLEIEKNGAGAIVLKSIFEEQIRLETQKLLESDREIMKDWKKAFGDIVSRHDYHYEEALQYISSYASEHTLSDYLKFVGTAKQSVSIPLIASINCVSAYDWMYYARKIQEAGADAIELNVYLLPSDFGTSSEENEKIYEGIIREVKKYITIPFAVKIGFYFSSLAGSIQKISQTGVNAVVLFNRPFNPDIDIDKLEFTSHNMLSAETEYNHTLRWTGILSGRIGCEICASTGIHEPSSAIKMILAGAQTVQIASVLYQKGFARIREMIVGIGKWMDEKHFRHVEEFRGLMSMKNVANPAAYERVQFMKHYSEIE